MGRIVTNGRRALLVALLAWGCTGGMLAELAQADEKASEPRQWALLIGCEKYHRASRLRFTINDVSQLAKTFRERGGLQEDRLLQITDDESNPRFQPLRASLEAEIPAWLRLAEPQDQVIVYFTGHGFRDADGKMYLAPIDCDPARPVETGIAVEWFREQIALCRANFKLLIIDSCHAGSEKGEEEDKQVVAAKELGEPFRDLTNVITLASSTGDEKSQIWEDKQQSLYSYWLNQGLKGHADENGDNSVDVDELNKFVYQNVVRSAKKHFPRPQTPVRIVRTGVEGAPTVLQLKPLSLKDVLVDMSEQLTTSLAEQSANRVAVLEFTNDTALGELLGKDFGTLGRYCSEDLERRLQKLGEGTFSVVDRRRLQNALTNQNFAIDDLGSPDALTKLSKATGGLPVLAIGTLRNRNGRVVTIGCKLIQTETGDVLASASGTALLDANEWGMLGKSGRVKDAPLPGGSEAPSVDNEPSAEDDTDPVTETVEELEQESNGPHPLADPNFKLPVRILVNNKERKGVLRGNDYIVKLRKGEKYAVQVANNTNDRVMMRLMIDGLNTLPQEIEEAKGIATEEVAPRVNLGEARHWVLDANKRFAVKGFVNKTGEQGIYREFVVVDADESLAARKSFTDQVGLITVAFYQDKNRTRGAAGTQQGDEVQTDLTVRQGTQCGQMIAVVNIRYELE
jgi:hypothetical protein